MTLLEQWRVKAYGDELDARTRDQLWNDYFAVEKGIYQRILKDPSKVYEGTVDELAGEFGTDQQTMVGFIDGINESLKGYENPIETMDETTVLKIEIDPEMLYYNMVGAKATWLYGLEEWNDILSEEKRAQLYKENKASGTVRREGKKIYPNDPCPCGSGKKYKKCCGKNA
ncbi:MAG: SEC-C metal-binding domain-containing protein [Eubacteriales bacterium]|nr:SEC-C metal-binding domain-containing protein [Eubacteriales bacterium]